MISAADRTTSDIVRAIRQGHEIEENYRQLYHRYYRKVYGYFLFKGVKPEDARDLTQNTFLSVFTCTDDLLDESKFEGWLFSIALNALRREREKGNAGKRKAREVVIVGEGESEESERDDVIKDLASPAPDPQQATLEREKLALLHDALLELPEQRRRCTLLYINNNLKYHQIADLLGISINTVKAHLREAKTDLRKKLGPYFGDIDL